MILEDIKKVRDEIQKAMAQVNGKPENLAQDEVTLQAAYIFLVHLATKYCLNDGSDEPPKGRN